MKLHFTEKALRLIAQKALAKNTGARGLRAILESILTEAMYEVSKTPNAYVEVGKQKDTVKWQYSVCLQVLNILTYFIGWIFQIPDLETGRDRVDAVAVDEESVGSVKAPGCGGKILRGDGALERYLAEYKLKESGVYIYT